MSGYLFRIADSRVTVEHENEEDDDAERCFNSDEEGEGEERGEGDLKGSHSFPFP